MTIIPEARQQLDPTILQKQQHVTSQLLLLLSQRLPVCDWNISLRGSADGQADTVEAVRVWASVIAGGLISVTQDGRYLEAYGVGDNAHIRVWAKRPAAPPAVEPGQALLEQVSQRAALKVLTRAADVLATQMPADADLFNAIRGAALLYTPFGPQAKVLADAAIAAFVAHLHYCEGEPIAYLSQWVTIRDVEEIATELRVAGGRN